MVSYFGIIIRHFFWKNWNPAKWFLLTTRFHEIEILLVTSSLCSFAFKQYSTSWVVVKGPVVSHLVFQALTQTLKVSHFRGQFFFFFPMNVWKVVRYFKSALTFALSRSCCWHCPVCDDDATKLHVGRIVRSWTKAMLEFSITWT